MKKLITLLFMACLTTAGFAFLPYDVSVTQRDATNTKFNTIYIGASGAITDTASFRSTLGIPGLTVANTWTASQTYSGTGLRLIGDLSNATHTNRLLWQTSTSNGNSLIGVLPNGTAKVAGFNAYGSSDPDNSSQLQLISDQTNSLNRINSKKTGTGTTLPVAIQFDDVTYVKFGTNGLTTITANTTDPGTSGATDTLLHLVQADNISARVLGDSASNVGLVLTGRMSGGTMASPSATPALNDLLVMAGRGYANGAYTATKAFVKLTALNTWTASDNSTFFTISLTPSGSTTVSDYFVLKSDNLNIPITTSASSSTTGSVTIGNGTAATNVGIGGGNIYAGGTINSGSGGSAAGAMVLTQGTAQSTTANSVTIQAPTSVTAFNVTMPTVVGSTGLMLWTVSGSTATLSSVTALPNGTTATTQSASDNSTKVATTAYVDTAVSAAKRAIDVAFLAYPGFTASIPASAQFFAGQPRTLRAFDTTGYTQARIVVTVGNTAADSGAVIGVRYYTSDSTTFSDYLAAGASSTDITVTPPTTTNTSVTGSWVNLTAGAIGDKYFTIYTSGGTSSANTSWTQIAVQFR